MSLLAPSTPVTSIMPGAGLLPIPSPAPLQNLGVPMGKLSALQASLDPSAAALGGVTSQPPLMGNVDPSKVDEIRRTVYVGNLNSQTTTAEQLLEFFKQVGDVKFVRMAGDETQPTRFAFVEFADQESVSRALTFNGVMFGDRPLKINHSNNAIVKPPELTPQAAAKELEDVMKRVREAQSTIAAAIVEPAENKKRSSSRSRRSRRSPSRSSSLSRSRRKRSRSKHRSKPSQKPRQRGSDSHGSHKRRDHRHSRSRSRDRRKERDGRPRNRDNDWEKEERRGRDKKGKTPPKTYGGSRRSRSTSRVHRRRSRTRSRSPRRKARSPSLKRGKKDRKRDKVRDHSRERRERSTSRKKSSRDDKQDHKAKPVQVERDYDNEEREYESEADASGSASEGGPSPRAQHNGSYGAHGEEDELSAAEATE